MSPVRLFFLIVVGGGLGLILVLDWLSGSEEEDADTDGGSRAGRFLWKLCVSLSVAFLLLLGVLVIRHIIAG